MTRVQIARRVELRLKFENVENPTDDMNMHLTGATYTDNEDDSTDDFQIEYEDRENSMLGHLLTPPVKESHADVEVVNYVVKRGDTLWGIASRYLGSGTKYPQIAQENNIPNPNLIYPGQVFRITVSGKSSGGGENVQGEFGTASPRLVTAVLVQKNWNDTGESVTLNIGTFEIDSINMSGPPGKITVKGTSVPYTASTLRMERKSRAWENYTLKGIAEEIASKSGLKLMYESHENPK